MRHLQAWASSKLKLGIVLCVALGAIALAWGWLGSNAPASGAEPMLEEPIDAALEADLPGASSAAATAGPPSTVIVYISGAVRAPDVYELPSEARIKDLVLAAGGPTAGADTERINLAERLKDGQQIHMPRQGEPASDDGAAKEPTGTAQGGLLDLNTASATDLEGLPGIGASLAERIVEFRTSNGPLKSVEDLRNVKGIGPALFTKIAPLITVGP
jgi:competence protein ComEA